MQWFKKAKGGIATLSKREIEVDLWVKCNGCKEGLYKKDMVRNLHVCEYCGYHFRMPSHEYVRLLLDEGSFEEFDAELQSSDPLKFHAKKRYRDSIQEYERKIGMRSAVLAGMGSLDGSKVSLGIMDFRYAGGSLGVAEGEKLARVVRRALEQKTPAIIVSQSGGARMQEGALSLLQMAKTSAYLAKLDRAGLPFISLLTNPTMGGVTASYAMLGDVNVAEPGALIGFAGPRVIKETIRQELPDRFQTAEFLMEKGFVDCIIPRQEMKARLGLLLSHFAPDRKRAQRSLTA